MEVLARKVFCRVNLEREPYRAVQKLNEAVVLSSAQKFFRMVAQKVVEEYFRTLYHRNAVALAEIARVNSLDLARYPFFRKEVVRAVVVTVVLEYLGVLFAAEINSVNPVPIEKNRLFY